MPVQDDNSNDKPAGTETRSSGADAIDPTTTMNRLERALERETHASEGVRDDLQRLRDEVAQLHARFQEQLNEATAHRREAEARLADQSARLNALGTGRETTMRELQETRAELARVAAERDRLQKELVSLSGMQTETVALPDDEDVGTGAAEEVLPTLDELMANWSEIEEAGEQSAVLGDSGESVDQGDTADPLEGEMLSPDAVFSPEDFGDGDAAAAAPLKLSPSGATASTPANPSPAPPPAGNSRVLVFVDAEPPMKFPLYKAVITIGRSDIADIQVDSDFISRIHARIFSTDEGVIVEDAGSTNGIAVNDQRVQRQTLRHGDMLTVGKAHFTFVDAGPATD